MREKCNFLILLALSVLTVYTVVACPQKCTCKGINGFTSVSCQKLQKNEIIELFSDKGTFLHNYAKTLQNFSLQESELTDLLPFPAAKFQQLISLDLSNNQLNSLDFSTVSDFSLSSLTKLVLDGNKLASISRQSFMIFPNVEEISVKHNGIFAIDWEAFRLFRLKRLYLGWNYLPTISEHMLRFTPNLELLDLSHNQISIAQSSSFFAAQHLRHIDLSFNRIQRFFYDSFSPLFQEFLQLETLDLAHNNLSTIPADLKQFIALRRLNFSSNPIEKICVGDLVQPVLEVLNISYCPKLKLIEGRAFAKLPLLQTTILANNSMLNFVSPSAFYNISSLFELDLSGNALETLDESIVKLPIQLYLSNNPLNCACIFSVAIKYQKHLMDYSLTTCSTSSSPQKTLSLIQFKNKRSSGRLTQEDEQCGSQPVTPMGLQLLTEIGAFYSIYCAAKVSSDKIIWTFPNHTQVVGSEYEFPLTTFIEQTHNFFGPALSTAAVDASPFLGGLFPPQQISSEILRRLNARSSRPRVFATKEQLRFETVTAEDAGEYLCHTESSAQPHNQKVNTKENEGSKLLKLSVLRPTIIISTLEVGSHYVSVAWNGSLNIRASDKVGLSLDVRDGVSGTVSRIIQLALYNPWHSYNVMRLKPLNNYTFCLVYRLNQLDSPNKSIDKMQKLYESCVDAQTQASLNFWNSISASSFITISIIAFCLASLCCFRTLYTRFFIWHDTKQRSRMNQSISGQSFLSSSNGGSMSQSVTFENTPQRKYVQRK